MIRNPRAGARKSGGFRLEVFTDDELREIHGATLEVLSRTGVFVEDDEAREIFAAAGAEVDRETNIVRLPAHLVEDAVRSAPSTVVMCGRDPARDVVLEDGRVGFTNFGEGIQVVDPYTGELHESRKQDVADCTQDHRRPARDRRRRAAARRPRRAAGHGGAAQRRGDLQQHDQARDHRPALGLLRAQDDRHGGGHRRRGGSSCAAAPSSRSSPAR